MPITADALRQHLDYSAWASRTLVDSVAELSEEELTRDFKTSDRSVLGTLVHIFAGDRVWFGRVEGNPPARFIDPDADMRLTVLQADWPALHERWRAWASRQSDASICEPLHYRDLKGNPYSTPLWQVVLHVVNHATHHRGQVSGFLRAMGRTPAPLDLIRYYRDNA